MYRTLQNVCLEAYHMKNNSALLLKLLILCATYRCTLYLLPVFIPVWYVSHSYRVTVLLNVLPSMHGELQ